MKKKRELTEFGKIVKKELIDKNMSQRKLAELVGTNENYLNLIFFGERAGNKYIYKISEVLDIKVEKYVS